jgi:leukotriene-A4 hydrolase
MVTDMNNFGMSNSYSSLTPNVANDNPDNAFSTVPYEKGYQFLTYLESIIGHDLFGEFM